MTEQQGPQYRVEKDSDGMFVVNGPRFWERYGSPGEAGLWCKALNFAFAAGRAHRAESGDVERVAREAAIELARKEHAHFDIGNATAIILAALRSLSPAPAGDRPWVRLEVQGPMKDGGHRLVGHDSGGSSYVIADFPAQHEGRSARALADAYNRPQCPECGK